MQITITIKAPLFEGTVTCDQKEIVFCRDQNGDGVVKFPYDDGYMNLMIDKEKIFT